MPDLWVSWPYDYREAVRDFLGSSEVPMSHKKKNGTSRTTPKMALSPRPPVIPRLATTEDLAPHRLTHTLFAGSPPQVTHASELEQAWRDGYTAGHMDTLGHVSPSQETHNPYGAVEEEEERIYRLGGT